MATGIFYPSHLKGAACIPPAKSEAHRALLLAAFGQSPCVLHGFSSKLCDDTHAMINGITALGAKVEIQENSIKVTPINSTHKSSETVNCNVHACAAALRMLIPAFLAKNQPVCFQMDAALYARPLNAFYPLFEKLGVVFTKTPPNKQGVAYITIDGCMPSGSYEIDGTLSSQFASGMLIALSHIAKQDAQTNCTTLQVTTPIVSRPYLDMTLKQLNQFGVEVLESKEGFFSYSSFSNTPTDVFINPDWSQTAVFLCANAFGNSIYLSEINCPANNSQALQGDYMIIEILRSMGMRITIGKNSILATCPSRANLSPLTLDCSDIPDLAPILALTCTQASGLSTLTGVHRLRVKECDRLDATVSLISSLGAKIQATDEDTLNIWGPCKLKGDFTADAKADHRMVMLLAIASLQCDKPITVQGIESINKSWPSFFETYKELGGKVE